LGDGWVSVLQGFTEKMLPQLEKSVGAKLEGTVTRQIQTQFQTIGRQVLQVIEQFLFAVVGASTS
jgi:parvulin-like peptidyl-prolyl isomerase